MVGVAVDPAGQADTQSVTQRQEASCSAAGRGTRRIGTIKATWWTTTSVGKWKLTGRSSFGGHPRWDLDLSAAMP